MGHWEIRQEELLRQRERISADFLSRQIGVALTCGAFSFFGPLVLGLSVYAICAATEYVEMRLFRRVGVSLTPAVYAALLANSLIAFCAFSFLGAYLFRMDDPLIQFAAVMSLTGALIHVSGTRATHLPLAIASGLPPCLALIALPLVDYIFHPGSESATLATVAAIGLVGYFGSALVQNYTAQSRLAAAVERARSASEAKSRFLTGMNHEMRTPLNTILGLAQSLRGGGGRAASTAASEIEEAAFGLRALVEDVLDLASAEEGALIHSPATAIVRREIETIHGMIAKAAGGRAIVKPLVIEPGTPKLARFDALLLRKCATKVAARLLPAQHSSLRSIVALSCGHASNGVLRLRIEAETAPEVTERPTSQSGPPGGNSHVLSDELIDQLARVLGARVTDTFDPSKGRTAEIAFPAISVDDLPEPADYLASRHLSVLVVDDIATNRFVIIQLLRSIGVDSVEADSGSAALAALGTRPFEVVLLDMNMPDMSGEETFRAIRSSGAGWSHIPVVALTADAQPEQRGRYLALGLDGYVAKPVDSRILWAEIVSAHSRRAQPM